MIQLKLSSWQILSICDNKGFEMNRAMKYMLLPSLHNGYASVQDNINHYLESLGFYNNSPVCENCKIGRGKSWLALFCHSNTDRAVSLKAEYFYVHGSYKDHETDFSERLCLLTCFPDLLSIFHQIRFKNHTHKSVVPWFPYYRAFFQMWLHWQLSCQ